MTWLSIHIYIYTTTVGLLKKPLTIQHVDHYTRSVSITGNAGVISAVARSCLRHQELARRAAFRFLRLQGNTAPVVNAGLSKISLCLYT